MTSPQGVRHPRIVLRMGTQPGRYRRKSEPGDVGELRQDALVVLDVGAGVRAADLPQLVAFARDVRQARKVLVLGRSNKALAAARRALLAAWELPDAPDVAAAGSAASWAALMLAADRDTAGGEHGERHG